MLGGSLAGQTALGERAGANILLPTYARPTFRAIAETAGAGSRTSVSLTTPAGVVAGDVLVAWIEKENNTTVSVPSGWQSVVQIDSGASRSVYAWKRAVAGEAGPYSFSWTTATWAGGVCLAFSSVWPDGDPNSVTPSSVAPTGTAADLPLNSITPAHVGSLLIGMVSWVNDVGRPGRSLAAAFMPARGNPDTVKEVATGDRIHQGSYPIPATGPLPWMLLGTPQARRAGVLAALKPAPIPFLMPAAATLTLTGYAPTVTATTGNLTLTPTTATLTVTGYAPTLNLTLTPSVATLTTATFAPTVTVGSSTILTPGNATLTTATFAPTLDLKLTPSTATLTASAFAPTVTVGSTTTITPVSFTLVLTGYAPRLDLKVTPTTAILQTTQYAPDVLVGNAFTPSNAALTLTGFAPTVTVSNHITLTPTTATITTATFAPTLDLKLTPATATLNAVAYAPTVTLDVSISVTPSTTSLTLTTYAPVLDFKITPATGTLTLTGFAPTLDFRITPTEAGLTLTTYAPAVLVPTILVPSAAALTLTGYAPQAVNSGTLIISVINLAASYEPAVLGTASYIPVIALEAVQE